MVTAELTYELTRYIIVYVNYLLNCIDIYFNNNYYYYIIRTVHTIQIVEKRVKQVQYLSCLPL